MHSVCLPPKRAAFGRASFEFDFGSCELQHVGPQLTAAKHYLFTTKPLHHAVFAEVSQDVMHVETSMLEQIFAGNLGMPMVQPYLTEEAVARLKKKTSCC